MPARQGVYGCEERISAHVPRVGVGGELEQAYCLLLAAEEELHPAHAAEPIPSAGVPRADLVRSLEPVQRILEAAVGLRGRSRSPRRASISTSRNPTARERRPTI